MADCTGRVRFNDSLGINLQPCPACDPLGEGISGRGEAIALIQVTGSKLLRLNQVACGSQMLESSGI